MFQVFHSVPFFINQRTAIKLKMPCMYITYILYEYVSVCEIKYYITSSEFYNSVQCSQCCNDHAVYPNLTAFSPESSYHECRTIFVRNIKLKQEVFPFLCD